MLANEGAALPAHRLTTTAAELSQKWRALVLGSKSFEDEMTREGVRYTALTSADFTVACGSFADMLKAGTIWHGNQPALNAAVKAARWRSAGTQGERAFQLKDCPEVGPLAAAVRALHGLPAAQPPPPPRRVQTPARSVADSVNF